MVETRALSPHLGVEVTGVENPRRTLHRTAVHGAEAFA
jgi:hypothetical protein